MTVNLSALGGAGQQFFDNNGNVLTGGKLWSYQAGTTTPQTTYTSASGATAHTNPIVLDSAGRVATGEIWVTAGQNYKFVLMTSANVTIATWDNITGINGTGIPSNADNVEYDPPFTGGVATTVQGKLQESVSVFDFIDPIYHAGIIAGTSSFNCLPAFNAALAASKKVNVPSGVFNVSGTITLPERCTLAGYGEDTILNAVSVTGPVVQFGPAASLTYGCRLENLAIRGTATKAVSVDNAANGTMENIWASGTFTDGFYFNFCYPGNFKNLYTNGALISRACFEFRDEVNACHFDNLYTSTFAEYNFLIDGTGHGNTWTNPTAQGGRYGFYMKTTGAFVGYTVNGLYTENCVRPIVLGERGSPSTGGAISVVFNGPMLAGPEVTHPYYSECLAAIELNSCTGAVFNGVGFLGLSRTGGGYPVVTITGDGTGALAWARVTPTGEINSIVVLTQGSGYTTASVAITVGGSSATATATISGGKVISCTVTNPGSGYKRTQTPMAVVYDHAFNVVFNGSPGYLPVLGANSPLYPAVVPYSSGGGSQFASTIIINDTSVINGSIGGSAVVQKRGGGGNFKFSIIEYDISGSQINTLYEPAFYP